MTPINHFSMCNPCRHDQRATTASHISLLPKSAHEPRTSVHPSQGPQRGKPKGNSIFSAYKESKLDMISVWLTLLALAALPSAMAFFDVQCPTPLNPLVLRGRRFFDSVTGEYFPIKGIAYYPRPNTGSLSRTHSVDFFTESFRDLWEADIENFKALGVNTIRLYAVDPSQNHDAFMCALQEAGIYVMVGLLADCFECAVGPDEAPSCYPAALKERGQFVINSFTKYTNTLAFSAGNEVTLYARGRQIELNAPCQKKFLRDMRAYINSCRALPSTGLSRQVPVGLVNWDHQREKQALYFNCRTDPTDEFETAEWYGLNAYQHCNPAHKSVDEIWGWIRMRKDFTSYNLSVPVVIAEYGCREPFEKIGEFEAQRNWLQVDALYSQEYQEVFAGGVVFEYSAEKIKADGPFGTTWPYYNFTKRQYGVGYYGPIDCTHVDKKCEYTRYPEFDILATKMQAASGSFMPNLDEYVIPELDPPSCPTGLAPISNFTWPTDTHPDLPCLVIPTDPTEVPSSSPTKTPSSVPSHPPTEQPSASPSITPTTLRSSSPSEPPTSSPVTITDAPSAETNTPTVQVDPELISANSRGTSSCNSCICRFFRPSSSRAVRKRMPIFRSNVSFSC